MGIFLAVYFISDKKIVNYLFLLVLFGVLVFLKEELWVLFIVINFLLCI